MTNKNNKEVKISFLLRIGLAIVFLYAGFASFISPENWIGYLPEFLRSSTTLVLFSVYELILGLWLLSNKKIFYASILSAISMFSIVIFNLTLFDVVFRDVAIFFMTLALAVLSKGK